MSARYRHTSCGREGLLTAALLFRQSGTLLCIQRSARRTAQIRDRPVQSATCGHVSNISMRELTDLLHRDITWVAETLQVITGSGYPSMMDRQTYRRFERLRKGPSRNAGSHRRPRRHRNRFDGGGAGSRPAGRTWADRCMAKMYGRRRRAGGVSDDSPVRRNERWLNFGVTSNPSSNFDFVLLPRSGRAFNAHLDGEHVGGGGWLSCRSCRDCRPHRSAASAAGVDVRMCAGSFVSLGNVREKRRLDKGKRRVAVQERTCSPRRRIMDK
ncbi:hypothetical protein EVAR_29681_1 [Eumeta japonica]|uniref:Uncharacterized protein n=1 Tax=Eumeta variegata TaxID=151549 RepID=A0A4C1W6U3_EUMVA|nr:hypothetical protein EVAR_29681_1 [Eumeta japonica]